MIEETFPNLPPELFWEVGQEALLLFLCLREAANGTSLCEKAVYVGALAGIRGASFKSAAGELEAHSFIRLVKGEDQTYGGRQTDAILLRGVQFLAIARLQPQAWAKLRDEVFRRDNYACCYCGASGKRLECDHIVAISRGGTNEVGNLITACSDCNRSKHAKSLEAWKGRQLA